MYDIKIKILMRAMSNRPALDREVRKWKKLLQGNNHKKLCDAKQYNATQCNAIKYNAT